MDTFICPYCGADVRAGELSCPECGSDDTTGWATNADKWEADIPAGYSGEDDFDYQEFVKKEFGREPAARTGLYWRIAAILAACVFLAAVTFSALLFTRGD